MAGERANSFDHLYAHFLTQHLAVSTRKELFKQAWRTLKPGNKFVIIEARAYEKPLEMELRNAGFGVSKRRITAEELLKLGADNADMNAVRSAEARDLLEMLSTMPPLQVATLLAQTTGGKAATAADMKRINQQEVRDMHTARFNKYNGPKPSQEAMDTHKLVIRAIRGEAHYKQPFVVITAAKPRVRIV